MAALTEAVIIESRSARNDRLSQSQPLPPVTAMQPRRELRNVSVWCRPFQPPRVLAPCGPSSPSQPLGSLSAPPGPQFKAQSKRFRLVQTFQATAGARSVRPQLPRRMRQAAQKHSATAALRADRLASSSALRTSCAFPSSSSSNSYRGSWISPTVAQLTLVIAVTAAAGPASLTSVSQRQHGQPHCRSALGGPRARAQRQRGHIWCATVWTQMA